MLIFDHTKPQGHSYELTNIEEIIPILQKHSDDNKWIYINGKFVTNNDITNLTLNHSDIIVITHPIVGG